MLFSDKLYDRYVADWEATRLNESAVMAEGKHAEATARQVRRVLFPEA